MNPTTPTPELVALLSKLHDDIERQVDLDLPIAPICAARWANRLYVLRERLESTIAESAPAGALSPCPCGLPAKISAVDSAGRRSAHCDDEDCYWSIVGLTDEAVIGRWNRNRAATVPQGDARFSDRDSAALRMWRNHFISERTANFRELDDMDYEQARAHAEGRANELEQILFDAMDQLENKDAATTPPPAELGKES